MEETFRDKEYKCSVLTYANGFTETGSQMNLDPNIGSREAGYLRRT